MYIIRDGEYDSEYADFVSMWKRQMLWESIVARERVRPNRIENNNIITMLYIICVIIIIIIIVNIRLYADGWRTDDAKTAAVLRYRCCLRGDVKTVRFTIILSFTYKFTTCFGDDATSKTPSELGRFNRYYVALTVSQYLTIWRLKFDRVYFPYIFTYRNFSKSA